MWSQLISTSSLPPTSSLQPLSSLTPSTFHLFPLLPLELRLKIYHFILTTPHNRILHITTPSTTPKFLATTSTPPPLLSVSQETRYEALRYCSLSFSSPLYNGHIYLNPFTDLVYFGKEVGAVGGRGSGVDYGYGVDVDRVTVGKIRLLAVDLDDVWRVVHSGWRAQHCTAIHAFTKIREFTHLEELVLVRFDAPVLERRKWPGLVFEEKESARVEMGQQGLLGNELNSCFIQKTIQSDLWREKERYPRWNVPLIRIVDARAAGLEG